MRLKSIQDYHYCFTHFYGNAKYVLTFIINLKCNYLKNLTVRKLVITTQSRTNLREKNKQTLLTYAS